MAAVGKSGLLDGLRFRQQQKSADREGGGGEEFRSLVSASMLGTVDVEGGRSRVATEEEEEGRGWQKFLFLLPLLPAGLHHPSHFHPEVEEERGETLEERGEKVAPPSHPGSDEEREREREREIVAADEDDE